MNAKTSKSNWTLQKQAKSKGTYWQAVIGVGADRRRVSLGYISEQEAQEALVRLRAVGSSIVTTTTVRGIVAEPDTDTEALPAPVLGTPTNEEIREWALDDGGIASAGRSLLASHEERVQRMIHSGEYAKLPLRDFYEHLWKPVRASEAAVGTIERERHLWKPILEALGNVPLDELDTVRWDAFLRSHSEWAGRTRVLHQNAYRVALNYACETGILANVHRFRKVKGATERATPAPAALTTPEVERLLEAAPSAVHRYLWIVGFSTGLRPGELCSMRWEDVNMEAGTMKVRGTKTALSAAVIPLPPAAIEALGLHHDACGKPSEGPMWTYKGRVIGHYRSAIRTASKKAGLEGKVVPNSVRHSFATLAAMAGIPRAATRAMLRHSQRSEMIERAYEHPRAEQVSEALASFPRVGVAAK